MYKVYKEAKIAAENLKADFNKSGLKSTNDAEYNLDFSNMDADKLWTNIDYNVRKYNERKSSNGKESQISNFNWLPVRIFVSSTFKDFFCEREILVKEVFPELREWCRERRIFLLECDLRWGVPKDSTNEDTVLACMTMLDQCNLETYSQAFFLNLTGERYGWVPQEKDLPLEIFKRFDWVAGASVTLMEILIGAFRTQSKNALYMMRSSDAEDDWMGDMPKKYLESFRESDPLSLSMIHRLRKEISARFKNTDQLREYRCRYAGTVQSADGQDRVQIEGLEDFAKDVLAFFKDAITRTYSEHIDNVDKDADSVMSNLDNALHEKLCGKLCYQTFGQNSTLELLQEYVKHGALHNNVINTDEIEKEDFKNGTASLCLVGSSGSGKSVMLARLAQHYVQNSQIRVFTHFADASKVSATDDNLIDRIHNFVKDLLQVLQISDTPKESSDIKSLLKLLPQNPGFIVLLIIDGLELLDMNMTWLPTNWPPCCRCVISCEADNLPIMARLRNRYTHIIHIEELDLKSRENIVHNFYADYGKKLDASQLQSLIIRPCAAKPLWIGLACEELRLYGDYLTLTSTIKELPDDVPRLVTSILNRILKEDGGESGIMSSFLKMLLIAREGIWEVCARGLLNHSMALEESNEINMAQWCTVLRKLNPFIQQSPGMGFVIKHKSTKKELQRALYSTTAMEYTTNEEMQKWHAYAAEYYLEKCPEYEMRCREAPYHLYHAEKRAQLISILRSNDEIAFRMSAMTRGQIFDAWRCLNMTNASQQSMGNRDPSAVLICCQLQNSESCLLCGRYVGAPQLREGFASFCMSHSAHQKTCIKCDRFIGDVNRATRAVICVFCNVGRNRCCSMVTEDDRFHYSQHLRTSGAKRIFW